MKTTVLAAPWVVAALCLATPATADDKPAKGDLAKLQGTWKAQVGSNDDFKVEVIIKDNTVAVAGNTADGDSFEFKGDFVIDEGAKPFKTIDWKNFTSPDGDAVPEILALYEFKDNDTLRICSGGPGNGRPDQFKSGDGGGPPMLAVLTRDKSKSDTKECTAAAVDDAAPQGDLAKFQGHWTATLGPNKDVKTNITIKNNTITVAGANQNGEEFELKGEFKLNEKATPKTVDWINFKRANGDDMPDNLAIYEILDDGSIRVCTGGPGNERPTEFKAGDDGPPMITVLTRDKSKAEPAAEGAAAKGDVAKFQGKWTITVGPNKDIKINVTIKDNTVALAGTNQNGEAFAFKGEFKLDEKATPRTVDWIKFKRPDGQDAPDNLGIYEIQGDGSIKVCSGGPGNERPTEFKDGENGLPHTVILVREKD